MKLHNKKTGEIKNVNHNHVLIHFNDGETKCINSLAELNEEWEDVPEEPKEYWYLENNGNVVKTTYEGNIYEEKMQEIGNYFKTKEEAEKAVEKLKAWKRLKDKGFRFAGWYGGSKAITYEFKDKPEGYIALEECPDLDLLFGGVE